MPAKFSEKIFTFAILFIGWHSVLAVLYVQVGAAECITSERDEHIGVYVVTTKTTNNYEEYARCQTMSTDGICYYIYRSISNCVWVL